MTTQSSTDGTVPAPPVLVERTGGVLRLSINRPDKLNAVTAAMMEDLAHKIRRAGQDPSVRAIVLTGEGRAFCAGADLDAADEDLSDPSPATVDAASRLVLAIRDVPRPVVVAARGAVVGVGVSIVLAADLAYLSEDGYLLLAFSKVGLMPDGGATSLLAAHGGRALALRLMLLAERLPALEAVAHGLVAGAWSSTDYEENLATLLAALAGGPTQTYALVKEAVNAAAVGDLASACERERSGQLRLLAAPDFAEGAAAFAERRKPRFVGFGRS